MSRYRDIPSDNSEYSKKEENETKPSENLPTFQNVPERSGSFQIKILIFEVMLFALRSETTWARNVSYSVQELLSSGQIAFELS